MNNRLLCGLLMFLASASALAEDCGDLTNHYGPFDYTLPESKGRLPTVENYHFTREVELLISGKSGPLGADLDYTLGVFPNHHRALNSMSKLYVRNKNRRPEGAMRSMECYFDRAHRMNPKDSAVLLLDGIYNYKLGKIDKALEKTKAAAELSPESSQVNYNLGLLYLEKKDYASALKHAQAAYAKNFPLPGLKKKLQRAGKWVPPPPATESAAETAAKEAPDSAANETPTPTAVP